MKKILALLVLMQILPRVAMAVCTQTACPNNGETIIPVNTARSCGTDSDFGMTTCYKVSGSSTYYRVYLCMLCPDGTEKVSKTFTSECGNITYDVCETPCTPDDDFVATGNAGYEKKTTCTSSGLSATQYRCAAGWYGSSSNGTTGCTKCPSSNESTATAQSAAGTTDISGCYIPAGNSFSDGAGAGKYASNCGY